MKITFPTFVPSLITGITSSVTTFKAPPPNKDALFDFSIVGPLAGLLMSVAAVVVGSQLTLISDPATLPALPLEILRQSTLGGTIINDILGNGVLTVSEGARGTQAVAGMVIPLHPMAIAGYVSLFVNALALLPIGSKKQTIVACICFEAVRLSLN
jgi:membrane-associated protease RseP (regulator of RpoE activity)